MPTEKKSRKLFHVTIAEPDYYKDFHCIAAACRNNCCEHFWRITVDKATYKKYQQVKASKELKEALRKYIKRDRQSDDRGAYAHLLYLMNPMRCAFQSKEGLCKIQQELGEDFLCDTCRVYPRSSNRFLPLDPARNFVERGCDVSCEAVPQLFLHRMEPLQIATETFFVTQNHVRSLVPSVKHTLHEKNRPIATHVFSIQTYAIGVLQDRAYPIEHRLILLTWMFRKLYELEKSGQFSEAPMMLESFAQGVNDHAFDQLFAIDSEIPFGDVMSGYLSAVSFFPEVSANEAAVKLRKAMKSIIAGKDPEIRRKAFEKILRAREIYIEHILVNQLFVDFFPFFGNKDIWESTKIFVGSYLILRFMIAAYAGERDSITDEELVDLTAYWGKALLHGHKKMMQVVEMFEKNGFDSVAHMAVLIKS